MFSFPEKNFRIDLYWPMQFAQYLEFCILFILQLLLYKIITARSPDCATSYSITGDRFCSNTLLKAPRLWIGLWTRAFKLCSSCTQKGILNISFVFLWQFLFINRTISLISYDLSIFASIYSLIHRFQSINLYRLLFLTVKWLSFIWKISNRNCSVLLIRFVNSVHTISKSNVLWLPF